MKATQDDYNPRLMPGKKEEYEKEYELLGDSDKPRTIVKYKPKEYEEKPEKETEIVHEKVGIPVIKSMIRGMQSVDSQPIEDVGLKVVGSLFDKIKFLKIRIDEMQQAVADRETMNQKFNKEIDEDIEDLEIFLTKLATKEDIREFKLNISLLKMEKRKENNLFWREMTTLKQQLRELKEEYETQSNISQIFSGV
jgi:hypothetical protein